MATPIFSRLQEYSHSERISFAMPGHKNGRGLDPSLLSCDVTELSSTLDLHGDSEHINKSRRLLSRFYGSDESFISVCGSTSCIQAMLTAALRPGETVLAAADCHMSVINTCALCGYNLRFIPKTINNEFLIPDKLTDIKKILDKHSDIKAVIITSPTYYGICADIKQLADICHKRNIPLLIDEAHGAHFPVSDKFPDSAVSLGADAVCQSAHKTLDALTGAAFLHVNGNLINRSRLKSALSMFQSSSPSYVIASSADIARSRLENPDKWNEIHNLCCSLRNKLTSDTDIKILDNDDKTRIVLNFSSYKITGAEAEKILLKKYGIDSEMSDRENIVLIITASNTAEELDSLYNALINLTGGLEKSTGKTVLAEPPVCASLISPGKAFFAESTKIPFSESRGRISAVSVCAYPPGIPIIASGSTVTAEQIEYIQSLQSINAKITNLKDNMIRVI